MKNVKSAKTKATKATKATKTTTVTRKVADLIRTGKDAPLPLSVIPNHMGINLCSVDSMSWTRQGDGQLVSLTIRFLPASPTPERSADASPP